MHGNDYVVTDTIGSGNKFYRLQKIQETVRLRANTWFAARVLSCAPSDVITPLPRMSSRIVARPVAAEVTRRTAVAPTRCDGATARRERRFSAFASGFGAKAEVFFAPKSASLSAATI